jgi:hypothetical protein
MLKKSKRLGSILFIFNIFLASLLGSCGKDLNVLGGGSDNPPDRDPIVVSDKQRIASSHRVHCQAFGKCNEAIAKIIVFDKDSQKERTCTGFLVSKNIMVTSAKCLPAHLRIPHAICNADVYVQMPEIGKHKREMLNCEKVLSSSYIEEGQEPATVYSDLAYFSLTTQTLRRPLKISYDGLDDKSTYTLWRIRKENSKVGIITREYCRPIFDSYANPMSFDKHSPNIVMAGCNNEQLSNGAPVLDRFGYVRGVMNGQLQNSIKNFFYDRRLIRNDKSETKIAKLSFFTNFACAFTPEQSTASFIPARCRDNFSLARLLKEREEMIYNNKIHYEFFEEMRSRLADNDKANWYVRWRMKFEDLGAINHWRTSIVAECFNHFNKWKKSEKRKKIMSKTFSVYSSEVKVMFDRYLRAASIRVASMTRSNIIKFHPKQLKDNDKSSLSLNDNQVRTSMGKCSE